MRGRRQSTAQHLRPQLAAAMSMNTQIQRGWEAPTSRKETRKRAQSTAQHHPPQTEQPSGTRSVRIWTNHRGLPRTAPPALKTKAADRPSQTPRTGRWATRTPPCPRTSRSVRAGPRGVDTGSRTAQPTWSTAPPRANVGRILGHRELAHHAAVFMFQDVAVIHVGRVFRRLIIKPHKHF